LGTFNSKSGDNYVSTSLYRVIDGFAEFIVDILWIVVIAISICGLHDYIISSIKDRGIVEQRLVQLTNIT